MWRLVYVALASIWVLVVFSASAHAQALAPTTLGLASHDQKAADDMVQVITEKSAPKSVDKPPKPITKKRVPVIAKKPAQSVKEEPAQTVAKEEKRSIAKDSARTFALEPVRPMNQPTVSTTAKPASRFSFRTPDGKKESVPVLTQYYPKQIVYPYGKVDKHIDSRLTQAATIAQERAHAHSRSRCWHYVKDALLASGVIDSRPKSELARDAAAELVNTYGFKRLSVTDPFSAPVGSVLVYGTARSVGHVELRTKEGFVSDFRSPTPSKRPLMGVYAKL
ncbi:MAG: hypothetical protein DME82_13285 [Verrucomicrobia bacterium]|nr:MAG: hypothetical protein DME82_13285 [Verrucomicrobiota bacterium]